VAAPPFPSRDPDVYTRPGSASIRPSALSDAVYELSRQVQSGLTPADVQAAIDASIAALKAEPDPFLIYQKEAEEGLAGGYAPLDAQGKIPTQFLPPLAVTDTFVVASQAEMLSLTAQTGDVAIRTDNGRTYILGVEPASVLANWQEVVAAGQVQSVNAKTGVVTLTAADVAAVAKAGDTMAGTLASQGAAVDSGGALAVTSPNATVTDARVYGASSPALTTPTSTVGTASHERGIRFTATAALYLVAVRWWRIDAARLAPLAVRLWDETAPATPVWSLTTPAAWNDTTAGWREHRLAAGTQPLLVSGRQYVLSFGASTSNQPNTPNPYTPVGDAGLTFNAFVDNATVGTHPVTTVPSFTGIDAVLRTTVTSPNPAQSGAIRLPNGTTGAVTWRNANDGADLILAVDATNALAFAGSPVQTQALADARYQPLGAYLTQATADVRYLQIANAFTQALADARYISLTLPDVKGDLLVASGPDALARLAMGPDGQVLTADSAQALGVKWATPTAGGLSQATADGLYVNVSGDAMAGSLGVGTTNLYDLGTTALRWRKLWGVDGEFTNAPTVGGVALPTAAAIASTYLTQATATTTYVPLAGGSVMTGLLGPSTTNTRDLGTTALRWAKLWAVNAEFTNAPTIGGAALSTLFLAIGGGTLTGALTVSAGGIAVTGASTFSVAPTVGGSPLLTQTAGDARYLLPATAASTYVPLAGGNVLTGGLGPTTNNALDLGTTALRFRKLWGIDGEFTNTPTVGGVALPTFTTADARYLQSATAGTTYVPLAGGSVLTGLLGPTTTNTRDLGTTTLRWRKDWLVDGDYSGSLVVAVALTVAAKAVALSPNANQSLQWLANGFYSDAPTKAQYDALVARVAVLEGQMSAGTTGHYHAMGSWRQTAKATLPAMVLEEAPAV
jgi:hypothetical protein